MISALFLSTPALATSLDDVRRAHALAWGGDQEGGGPYVYPRDDDPDRVTGFEVDLAAKLAEVLEVEPRFVQGQWDRMPDMLRAHKVDVILNGYELTPERVEVMDATMPYYVYALQLLLRKGDPAFVSWESLRENHGRVGVLTGSAAETRMREFCGDGAGDGSRACTVVGYDGSTDAMREVETGKLDGTLQDTPIAAFYASRFPGLAPIGAPVAPGYYVIYVEKGQPELVRALNLALVQLVRNGDLEAIDRRYGIWDDAQQELVHIAESGRFFGLYEVAAGAIERHEVETAATVELATRKRGLAVVTAYGGVLVESAAMTVALSVLSFPLAIAVGLLVAVGRTYGPGAVRVPLAAYVEFLRGTPVMLQLYFVFFLLPEVGVVLPAFWCGVLGLAVNYSAYESEIYRAGLQAIPKGQMEAALALGMSRWTAIRRIVVPQAVRIVIPPVVNDFVALFKDTSVCSVVTIVELTKRFSVLSMSTQATIELMAMTAVLYLLMSYPMSLLSRRIERRLGVTA